MRNVIYLLFLFLLFACKEEEGPRPISLDDSARQVFILNEGNFRSANASISVYYPENGTLDHDVFQNNNNSRPLGDVVQSIVNIDNRAFVVVNNSSKIEVVDLLNFKSVGTINGLNSPRYILPINSNKAYVSDLYEDKIYVINPSSLGIVKTIESNGWTEEMVLVGDKAFVCQIDSSQVLVIDTQMDTIIKRIRTNKSPTSIGVDKDERVWVACTGGIQESFPAIHKINSTSLEIEGSMEVKNSDKSISHLSIDGDGRNIYYLMDGLYHMNILDTTLSSSPIVFENGRNFYGMGVDPHNGDIYLTDAIDYQQKGVVYRYTKSGNEVTNFKAGLIPSNFFFK